MWLYSDFPLYLFICVFLAPFCLLPFCLFCVCEVCILYCNVISLRIYCTNAACLGERRASTSWTGFTNRTKQKQSKVPKFNLLCMSQNIKIRCLCHKILIYASWANFFGIFKFEADTLHILWMPGKVMYRAPLTVPITKLFVLFKNGYKCRQSINWAPSGRRGNQGQKKMSWKMHVLNMILAYWIDLCTLGPINVRRGCVRIFSFLKL